MVMEFVDGQTLDHWMRQGHIPLDTTLAYIDQVLRALAYAHGKGVVHRDIKPANIMITNEGVVKLMDFGIARVLADQNLTKTGQVIGSLHYMSPEQIEGKLDVDGRSDLYSVGITLYEALTGKRPFDGESDFSIMAAHMQSKPKAPIELDPAMPQALNEIILMALAKDPGQRFQKAEAFRAALGSVSGIAAMPTVTATPSPAPTFAGARTMPAPVTPAPVVTPAAMPAQHAPVMAAAKPAGNRRVLYMLAGSLATIAVLIVLALQVPKFMKARADAKNSTATAQQSTPAAQQSTPAAEQAAPAATPVDAAANQPSEPAPVAAQTPAATDASGAASETASAPESKPTHVSVTRPARHLAKQIAAPSAGAIVTAPVPQPAVQTQPAAAAPAPDAAAMKQVRHRMNQLAARANPIRSSLDTLAKQQAASGLNLRGDIAGARQLMETSMDEAEANLRDGNLADARESLDHAERQIEILEKFLGR
ncbi:MAG: protein kinase domain-containing protein, partial [Bryobacteraceae bacterium]